LYELIRWRCRYIIVVDAECDPAYSFLVARTGDLHGAHRLRRQYRDRRGVHCAEAWRESRARGHWTMGTIRYKIRTKTPTHRSRSRSAPDGETEGKLLYIKNSFPGRRKNGHISADVIEYAKRHSSFLHDITADQFFNEQQFESYRNRAECIATRQLLADAPPISDIKPLFEYLQPHGGVG
jgi:hypothetical protein